MDFTLSPDQDRVRALCRELAAEFAERAPVHDRDGSLPLHNIARLREAGLFGIGIPKELGGLGVGADGWVAAAEELAQGCASTALGFNMHVVGTALPTRMPGVPDEHRERVARLVIDEGKLICAPLSEPGASSLIAPTYVPTIEALAVDGGYELRGRKVFASFWEASDFAFMFAHPVTDANPLTSVGMLVPTQQDGVTVERVWDPLGMRATASNQVHLDGAFVPEDLVLCQTDDFLQTFIIESAPISWGGYSACYLGVGLGMLAWAKRQLATRKGKGIDQAMGYHPSISTAVGQAEALIEAARGLMYRATWEYEANGPSLEAFRRTALAKHAIGEGVQKVGSLLTTACGLHGLFRDQPFERMLRDSATAPIMPPNSFAVAEMIGLLSMGLDPTQAPGLRMAAPPPAPATATPAVATS